MFPWQVMPSGRMHRPGLGQANDDGLVQAVSPRKRALKLSMNLVGDGLPPRDLAPYDAVLLESAQDVRAGQFCAIAH